VCPALVTGYYVYSNNTASYSKVENTCLLVSVPEVTAQFLHGHRISLTTVPEINVYTLPFTITHWAERINARMKQRRKLLLS
jgi:hypothetical protein